MWEKGSVFVRKVGGTILTASVIIWFCSAFPRNVNYTRDYDVAIEGLRAGYAAKFVASLPESQKEALQAAMETEVSKMEAQKEGERISKSYAGQVGRFIEPAIRPLGFDWQGGVALMTGIAAKEIVVSTFGILYQVGSDATEEDQGLQQALRKHMNPLSALAFMFFTLIYIPCVGALGVMYRELGSLKWTLFAVGYSLTLAWLVAFAIFQGGKLLGFGV
jgi:ferrous iron transport protein B